MACSGWAGTLLFVDALFAEAYGRPASVVGVLSAAAVGTQP